MATVDAIRSRDADEQPAPATTELDDREALSSQLSGLGVGGELLLYGDGCRLRRLELPSLELSGDDESGCVPRGAESPDGSTVARCLGDKVELFTPEGLFLRTLPGCAPAWRPDGTLTVARRRDIVRFRPCPDGRDTCTRVLIGRAELERAARRHPTVPERPVRLRVLIDGVAWLSESRAAVLLSIRMGGRLAGIGAVSQIAFVEMGRLAGTRAYFQHGAPEFAASPRGSYLTQAPNLVVRRDGSQVSLPPYLRAVHAFAWSKDERFLALATRFAVTVLEVASLERYDDRGGGLRSVTLPVSAHDLAWR